MITWNWKKNESDDNNQPKRAIKKLIHASKLNASSKTLEGERNLIYTQLSEVDKTNEELTKYIKSLQNERDSLQSEYTQMETENQKHQTHSDSPLCPWVGGRGSKGPGILRIIRLLKKEETQTVIDLETSPITFWHGVHLCPRKKIHKMTIPYSTPLSGQPYVHPTLPPQGLIDYLDQQNSEILIFHCWIKQMGQNLLKWNAVEMTVENTVMYMGLTQLSHQSAPFIPAYVPSIRVVFLTGARDPFRRLGPPSSRKHAWSFQRLFSFEIVPSPTIFSIHSLKCLFTERFSLLSSPKHWIFPPIPISLQD
ncbi:cTAGE family member 2 [Galemys pyrenaicus]|uniref:CTAGE family member 2 n=1 Tax=Galemys pyrenaicus TaxID=202257 RepID=A0A8J6DLZ7_GALPY|nr:cTAGE family member 2 [Galemys pyrenaicus]